MTILQGQEGGEAIMGGKRPKDPMFGQWIKLQMSLNTTANTTLNTILHQSFDDQVYIEGPCSWTRIFAYVFSFFFI